MKKQILKTVCCAALAAAITFSVAAIYTRADASQGNALSGEELIADMRIGWNLGNTFDAPNETAWGNPLTTKEMLVKIKELGFDSIRIPITWSTHVTPAPDFQINEKYMARVDEVVNDALDAGLYVIINSHHDNGLYSPTPENSQKGQAYLTAIWTQIAEHFKDADYKLIFQTMNEPRVEGTSYEWAFVSQNPKSVAAVETVNELNQAAVNAIRATGGNNADRFIIVSTYAGNPGAAMSSIFELPADSAEDKLIVSIHAYVPYNLALNKNSKETTFGKAQKSEIRSLLKNISFRFVRKGIPVIIDEMGCLNKNNSGARYEWAKVFVSSAKEYGMTCMWWDNGQINSNGENFGLLDRRTLDLYPESELVYQGLMDGLTESVK